MNNQTAKEYDIAIHFYEKIIAKFSADLSYYKGLIRALKPNNILELGCGSGRLFSTYVEEGVKNITGIDISKEMIQTAKSKYPFINLYQGDITNFNIDTSFDLIVISNSMLKHIEGDKERKKIIEKAKQYLSPNGVISFDHSDYLYYIGKTSKWYEAKDSIIADWIPNQNGDLEGYQWRKEVAENEDIIYFRHLSFENKVDFEVKFSAYLYSIENLKEHLISSSLSYIQVLTDYLPKGFYSIGKRFIGIASENKKLIKKYNEQIIKELRLL